MAAELISTKPYMIRAIHEWCIDNALTPHLLVVVDPATRVPQAFVKDGEIVLNLSFSATKDLHIDNDAIVFSARFSGASQQLYIPIEAVKGIYARENGQGMFFELTAQDKLFDEPEKNPAKADTNDQKKPERSERKRPNLTVVK